MAVMVKVKKELLLIVLLRSLPKTNVLPGAKLLIVSKALGA